MNWAENFARRLSREFSRELKGEGCWVPNLKLGGYASQLTGDEHGFALVLYHFQHKDEKFRRAHGAYVMIRATRPESRHGETREIKAVRKALGVRAFQVTGRHMILDSCVLAFCRKHQERLMQLKLRGADDIGVYSSAIRFRWVARDPAEMHPRFLAFAHLMQELIATPTPQPQFFTREWILKSSRRSEARLPKGRHSFGGKLPHPVRCPHCGSATNLMARVDLSDPALPRTKMGRTHLPVFWCLDCLEWEPTFFDVSGPTPQPLDAVGRKVKTKRMKEGEDDLPERRVALVSVPSGKKAGRKSKIGGAPSWIQMDDRVDCPRCEKQMAFVLQLASNSHFEFDDMGLLYVFACPTCKITASLTQSH